MTHEEWFETCAPRWCACFCWQDCLGGTWYCDIRSHSLLDAVCDLYSLKGPWIKVLSYYQFTPDGPVAKD